MIEIKQGILSYNINYKRIPVTQTSSVEEFNEVYQYLKNLENEGKISYGIYRTKSGGISNDRKHISETFNRYDVTSSNIGAEILCIAYNNVFRLQFRSFIVKDKNNKALSGTQAFNRFKEELLKDGINIENYYIENGSEIKQTIEKPLIKVISNSYIDLIFDNCHHLDIKSSYPSGMAEFYEEWRPTIERLYDAKEREKDNGNKECEEKFILNATCGYFQSENLFKSKLAHVSKYAIQRNNEKINEKLKWLKENNRIPLLINTDGIWYTGDPLPRSDKLGEWDMDHTNCRLRIKSSGAYEFIEDGKYFPVIRGKTRLDNIKPRREWNWGDIYKIEAQPLELYFDRELGIISLEDDYGKER